MNKKDISLKVNNLTKFYTGAAGSKLRVLEDINFTISGESFTSFLAPFAAGKSTLLKVVCGLEAPSEGEVFLNEEKYAILSPQISYIPEEPSSFPWLDVKENIGAALNLLNKQPQKVEDLISAVGLKGYEDHFPNDRSLGFRFRISLARALAVNPKIILLDDPFKNIDSETRIELYEIIRSISSKINGIFILATTNISEAIYLSEKIFFMKKNPGAVFSEMTMENTGIIEKDQFNSVRAKIESLLRSEKVINDINFSI